MEIRALHPAGRRRVAGSSQTTRGWLGDSGSREGYGGTAMEEGETLSGTYTAQVDAGNRRTKPFACESKGVPSNLPHEKQMW